MKMQPTPQNVFEDISNSSLLNCFHFKVPFSQIYANANAVRNPAELHREWIVLSDESTLFVFKPDLQNLTTSKCSLLSFTQIHVSLGFPKFKQIVFLNFLSLDF